MKATSDRTIRAVTHLDIRPEHVTQTVETLRAILQRLVTPQVMLERRRARPSPVEASMVGGRFSENDADSSAASSVRR